MKSWFFVIALVIVLAGSTVFNGLIYQDTQGKLAVEQQKVNELTEDLSSMTSEPTVPGVNPLHGDSACLVADFSAAIEACCVLLAAGLGGRAIQRTGP